ncbi:MAG: hypothetical protein ACRD8Z_02785 [Nitrososphaeraceae archaeon]
MTLALIRFLDDQVYPNKEWLIVKAEGREVTRFPWTADLIKWMNAHKKQIDEDGDINVFLEYRRRMHNLM